MSATLTLSHDDITPTLIRFGEVMRRPLQNVVVEAARRATRELIAIVPPASAGTMGRAAYDQGRSKIHRDMSLALAPRTLKGVRKERWPDVAAEYRARRVFRNSGVGARVGKGALIYVDRRKFLALQKELHGRIGRLASGTNAAAAHLKVTMPAWIKRHGESRGRVQQNFSGDRYGITVTMFSPEAQGGIRREVAKRIKFAKRYAVNGMARNIDAVVLKTARGVGMKVNRQPLGGSLAA